MSKRVQKGAGEYALRIAVTLDSDTFSRFAWFDAMVRRKRWQRPAAFAAIFTVLALIAFLRADAENQGALLGGVLLAAGLGLPLVWLASYALSLRRQAKAMGLPRAVYTVELDESGVTCYQTAAGAAPEHTPWADVYGAWCRPDAIYLYVRPDKAYLLPDTEKRQANKIWAMLERRLPKEKRHSGRTATPDRPETQEERR